MTMTASGSQLTSNEGRCETCQQNLSSPQEYKTICLVGSIHAKAKDGGEETDDEHCLKVQEPLKPSSATEEQLNLSSLQLALSVLQWGICSYISTKQGKQSIV